MAQAVPISPVEHGGYRSLKISSYGGAALSLSLSGHRRNVFEKLYMTGFA
jgi:hypothetical protein